LFTNNSFTKVASIPVSVGTGITLSVSGSGTVTVNWTADNARPGTDWIGLYVKGTPDSAFLTFQYVTPGTSGSRTFTLPSTSGVYEFRYFFNNGFTKGAVSKPMQVGGTNAMEEMLESAFAGAGKSRVDPYQMIAGLLPYEERVGLQWRSIQGVQ
jgi:hypothetical protein